MAARATSAPSETARARPAKRRPVGRPRSSQLSRAEQLRRSKRAQRLREREAGLVEVRLRLPRDVASRLVFAARQESFAQVVHDLLEHEVIEIARYPQLKLLCWSRHEALIAPRDAWSLYERNARFVDAASLDPAERRLIKRLTARFGEARIDA